MTSEGFAQSSPQRRFCIADDKGPGHCLNRQPRIYLFAYRCESRRRQS